MNRRSLIALIVLGLLPLVCAGLWSGAANARLEASSPDAPDDTAVAAAADVEYCNPELKKILRRVLQSCGLIGRSGTRGCQPLKAKNVASVNGRDFNALFKPMRERGAIVQFDSEQAALDQEAARLIDEVFAEQRGASFFFVVSRASPDGPVEYNRDLSKRRAEAVLEHLRTTYQDPDLDQEVGLLWLGEEFAQLDREFCDWRRNAPPDAPCSTGNLNRGAFIAWIDCRL